VLRVEAKHPGEGLERLRGTAFLSRVAPSAVRASRIVGVGLQQADEHADRAGRAVGAAQQIGQRERGGAVGRQQIEGPLVGGARRGRVAPLLLEPPSSNQTRTSEGRAAARR
jgi:hypothetical protein